jgi:hypothetical protein
MSMSTPALRVRTRPHPVRELNPPFLGTRMPSMLGCSARTVGYMSTNMMDAPLAADLIRVTHIEGTRACVRPPRPNRADSEYPDPSPGPTESEPRRVGPGAAVTLQSQRGKPAGQ